MALKGRRRLQPQRAFKRRAAAASPSLERQQWLDRVVEALRTKFADVGYTVPERIRVSIGWPKRAASCGAIGECWSTEASSDRHAELFISPQLTDAARIVDVLAHELDHATVGTAVGHGKAFKQCALAIGLVGPMRATTAGPEFSAWAQALFKTHRALPRRLSHRYAEARNAHAQMRVLGVRLYRARLAEVADPIRAANLSERSNCFDHCKSLASDEARRRCRMLCSPPRLGMPPRGSRSSPSIRAQKSLIYRRQKAVRGDSIKPPPTPSKSRTGGDSILTP